MHIYIAKAKAHLRRRHMLGSADILARDRVHERLRPLVCPRTAAVRLVEVGHDLAQRLAAEQARTAAPLLGVCVFCAILIVAELDL